jgi:hypothetical protein
VNGTDNLNYEEQDKLIINLTKYVVRKAKNKFWRTGNDEELSDGENIFSVVTLAFEKVLDDKRIWNPETEPEFIKYMFDVIDSLLSHLVTGKDNDFFVNENTRQFATNGERKSFGVLAASEEKFVAAKATRKFEDSEWLIRNQLSPEDELIAAEEKAFNHQVLQAIQEAAANDADVSAMIEAMENNFTASRDIAKHTGIDVDRIYNARKRLNTIVTKVKQQFDI